ncbi:MAG TPA: cupin domain-containing protein [Vicinamibacterales bacterium]|nr:cupin domain-containing protein [Vicinamibacterales bacterium]
MHYFGRFDEGALTEHPIFEGRSEGYTHAPLVDHATGSVHTGLSMNQLAPGGCVYPHVHSFEEGFYLLSGEAVFTVNGSSYRLGPGDYAAVKVGTPHAWFGSSTVPVRWLQMAAPQPRPAGAERDTFFLKDRTVPSHAERLDLNNLGGNLLGHFDVDQIPPPSERKGGLQGLEGVFLKWMIDENFGAMHHRFLFIEYQPGVSIAPHDHTFEEAYFILSGEVEGTLDGQWYRAQAGDVLWTGVGCVHTFVNTSKKPVRWLETFSPQPPKENVFRFSADWQKKARELEGAS